MTPHHLSGGPWLEIQERRAPAGDHRGADDRPDHEADHARGEPDRSGVPEATRNPNKQSNTGMDVTDFPDGLVRTQAAWNTTYQAVAAPGPRDTTALRRRLLLLSVRLWWHPYWETAPSVPAARSALRHLPRAHGAVRAAKPVAPPDQEHGVTARVAPICCAKGRAARRTVPASAPDHDAALAVVGPLTSPSGCSARIPWLV
ncbi:hypothetical protein GCM10010206_66160 [Streptomyces cinerochromogenes]|nr:hypothetical protein GCM10010206_66160 [Streptomyces cinerochromogenes]